MKSILKLIIFTSLLVFAQQVAFAQDDKTITVTASGDGPTKDKATNAALRNCIEKTLGVFISASSEVKNEELIKDQIATVASGNVIDYEIISELKQNENFNVTVSAKISPEKVASQLNSKGTVFELKGNVFAQNAIKEQFYKEQELIVIQDFFKKYEHAHFFDFTISVFEPKIVPKKNFSGEANELIKEQYYKMMDSIESNITSKGIKIERDNTEKYFKHEYFQYPSCRLNERDNGSRNHGLFRYSGKWDVVDMMHNVLPPQRDIYYVQILATPKITNEYLNFITSITKMLIKITINDIESYKKVADEPFSVNIVNLKGFISNKDFKSVSIDKSYDSKAQIFNFNLRNETSKQILLNAFREIYLKSTVLNLYADAMASSIPPIAVLPTLRDNRGTDLLYNHTYTIAPFFHQGRVWEGNPITFAFTPSRIIMYLTLDEVKNLKKLEFKSID